ncbi:NTP transferase domain-containing protein [Leptospira sp. 2 VSF19]|uniref:NTP transferase domain-containing protein n=1 Tax=Leptospira soteropolitanensis TaxID=2950025 RepID=A0AAW5VGJ4_9LEPT|nr:NTP transferase domain-containing protein [Leptospira soteropolitanensis]MCW7491622.1 NTP transferase domain-containing protein [Leptospira soteropolitanensis]MCW7499206.1 NTP transferase domain-containing protein [Leptospira soteropolitanensis]MCW7521202.1 NTP transferase domain-containing protein [Leptospira soteropolitanensis]MCW7525310.1 NTP transferase domain-containing protein [Leptospira soteropolitanensis]MCW7529177.1 NTP transferase domain-containing protein [Leptospira soteropolit
MNAFVLAAGFGKRMGSLTENCPKPLLKIQDITLLDYSLYLLDLWKVSNVLVNTHYLGDQIKNHLKRFKKFPITILEEKNEILGTAGGIRTGLSDKYFEEPILLINPDTLFFPDQSFKPKTELKDHTKIHLYLLPAPPNQSYTKIGIDENGKLTFGNGGYYYIGLAILNPKCLSHLEKNNYHDLSDIFKECAERGEITGEIFSGRVLDLGTKDLWEAYVKTDIFGAEISKIQVFLKSSYMA